MFRHIGETRTLKHNLRIASLLSFVAGMVNVAGFLSVQRLTTNVTGHFALLIDEVFKFNFLQGLIFFLYILFFLLGSFVSSFIVEFMYNHNKNYVYVLPAILEAVLLLLVPLFGHVLNAHPDTIAFILLFAMGLQNSLVTSISNAVVRTTHLTGLFTDLGIELSQLFFYKERQQREKLFSSIKLRLNIISFFFIGGVSSGFLYASFGLHVLSFSAVLLLFGIFIDFVKNQGVK